MYEYGQAWFAVRSFIAQVGREGGREEEGMGDVPSILFI